MMIVASEDTSENAITEISVEKIAFKAPAFHGMLIYAFSEYLRSLTRRNARTAGS
ncbi:hypothetical protein [Bradyrhizobium commune]|uniref:Uncharacterized protein n=1 Tax=Bradyrhizobium commune TaxID=83627 RepID=A0A7S9D3W2_9BRAD|nr:hypothetical protein [Bradyrhizobium commune]QPF90727.1 hypothetical protein IC761_30275 [Bradyrhizobium commune]